MARFENDDRLTPATKVAYVAHIDDMENPDVHKWAMKIEGMTPMRYMYNTTTHQLKAMHPSSLSPWAYPWVSPPTATGCFPLRINRETGRILYGNDVIFARQMDIPYWFPHTLVALKQTCNN